MIHGLNETRRRLASELPRFNSGPAKPDPFFINSLAMLERIAGSTELSSADDRAVCEFLGISGMVVCSAVRAGFAIDSPPVGPLLQLCDRHARRVDHPPRDSVRTYVLWNSRNDRHWARRFTNHDLETKFLDLTAACIAHYDAAAAIARAELPDPNADPARLEQARQHLQAVQAEYLRFRRETIGGDGVVRWFEDYKTFFPSLPIGGELWEPPSGAHLASVFELDLLLTEVDERRREAIRSRMRYLPLADRVRLRRMLDAPAGSWAGLEVAATPGTTRGIRALVEQNARTAATHYALLTSFVGKPADADPDHPAGEVMPHDQVLEYCRQRLNFPWKMK